LKFSIAYAKNLSYSKTNYYLKIWSYFKAIIHFQAIIHLDFGLNPEAQLLFEASNTIQRPIEKVFKSPINEGSIHQQVFFCVEITRMTSSYNSKRSLDNIGLEKNFFNAKKLSYI
jgi:hypothetical protein